MLVSEMAGLRDLGALSILKLRICKLRIAYSICLEIPMDLGIPPLQFENLLESNPRRSGFLARELTVFEPTSKILSIRKIRIRRVRISESRFVGNSLWT